MTVVHRPCLFAWLRHPSKCSTEIPNGLGIHWVFHLLKIHPHRRVSDFEFTLKTSLILQKKKQKQKKKRPQDFSQVLLTHYQPMTPYGVVRFWPHVISSVLKIGSVLAERVGQGEVGRCTTLADSAWWQLQLPVEKPWSMPGGPGFHFNIVSTELGEGFRSRCYKSWISH